MKGANSRVGKLVELYQVLEGPWVDDVVNHCTELLMKTAEEEQLLNGALENTAA